MAASDHLNGQQFYHGSTEKFDGPVLPGTLATKRNPWVLSADPNAYFTNNRDVAEGYARGGDGPGYVYHVQPRGAYKTDPNEGSAFSSRKPLAVSHREELSP